jgi:hypothetical protein
MGDGTWDREASAVVGSRTGPVGDALKRWLQRYQPNDRDGQQAGS